MSLNLKDLMLTEAELFQMSEHPNCSNALVAQAAVTKFAWGLVEDTNLIREVDKGEWRDALEAAGIQRPGAKP